MQISLLHVSLKMGLFPHMFMPEDNVRLIMGAKLMQRVGRLELDFSSAHSYIH